MRLERKDLLKSACFVNGEWRSSPEGTFDVSDPASREIIASVPDCGFQDLSAAVEAAVAAFRNWRKVTASERGNFLRKWHDAVLDNQEDLARIMTAEQGKPLAEARDEIAFAASFLLWYAGEAERVNGEILQTPRRDWRTFVLREPVGVAALITPWNFPAAMVARKAAAAIAAGCAVVLKPAEDTPLTALAMAALAEEAGCPPGVFNVITCSRQKVSSVGTEMARHEKIDALSFTGSTAVGKMLMAEAAGTVKRVSLELGGNAPFIVFDDADLDVAVSELLKSKFRNMGQACVAANRVFVQDSVYDAFTAKLQQALSGFTLGPGSDATANQGPLISKAALAKVEHHVAMALEAGARLVAGGRSPAPGETYFEPTVLGDVPAGTLFETEETFGPVAALFRFTRDDEVIERANDSRHGLAAYLFSRSMPRIWRVAEALEVGVVGVNAGVVATVAAPLGGRKESGIGREGGHYGIEEFLEHKFVCFAGMDE